MSLTRFWVNIYGERRSQVDLESQEILWVLELPIPLAGGPTPISLHKSPRSTPEFSNQKNWVEIGEW